MDSSVSRSARAGAEAARLRDDIDRGRTGTKVDWPDPAAVPLGTDEEAAGFAPSRGEVLQARYAELAGPAHAPRREGRIGAAWIMIAVVLVALGGTLAWLVTLGS